MVRAPSTAVVTAMLVVVASLATAMSQQWSGIDPPAPPGSTLPALAVEAPATVTRDHDILISWLAPSESGGRLRFARLSGETWSEPVTIAEPVSTLGPLDRPSLTVIDTQAVRRTLIARTGDVVARSGDGGRTWGRLPSSPLPFASFAGGDEGAYAFWLDADANGAARLLGTRVLAGGTLLDARVSNTLGTSAAMTWDGPIVVYGDRSADGILNIAAVRRRDARWTRPSLVHTAGWRPEPHRVAPQVAVPQVAALKRQVAVAWYSKVAREPQVQVAFSNDAGRTFGDPVRVDLGSEDHAPLGPVAVALDDDANALVLWSASEGHANVRLNLARVSPAGNRGSELVLTKGPEARLGGIPQIVRADERLAVTWVDGAANTVRAVSVPLERIPKVESATAAVRASSVPYAGRGKVGDPAPSLELVSLDGERVSLASLRGRTVLLNFWATWCPPCIQEMPELSALHERHRSQGLVVVGVNADAAEALDKVRTFVSERAIPFPVWLDPEMRLPRELRVRGLPANFIIDRDGQIVFRRNRAIEAGDPELQKALDGALRGTASEKE